RKTVALIAYYGAMRCIELVELCDADVIIKENEIKINIELDSPSSYTGTFRRSAATAFAETGASTLDLKKQFRWKSENVAASYVGVSIIVKP
ncbi:hypothetical protein A3Q56_02393, partial [Intoshia linei]